MSQSSQRTASRLNELLTVSDLQPLEYAVAEKFADYCMLLMHWNARMNLTAIRDQEGILSRHFLESIAAGRALPSNIATLLDFGSGAGFPGIPIALCRPEIEVTLAESQGKKAAFLNEAVRRLGLSAKVHSGRAETMEAHFDCVILRAVEKLPSAVRSASHCVQPGGLLASMTTQADSASVQIAAGKHFSWSSPIRMPGSDQRVLLLGRLNS